jgi:hypothetical protein
MKNNIACSIWRKKPVFATKKTKKQQGGRGFHTILKGDQPRQILLNMVLWFWRKR